MNNDRATDQIVAYFELRYREGNHAIPVPEDYEALFNEATGHAERYHGRKVNRSEIYEAQRRIAYTRR